VGGISSKKSLQHLWAKSFVKVNAAMELGLIAKVAGRLSGMDKFSKI
jgi:hypothetical protein